MSISLSGFFYFVCICAEMSVAVRGQRLGVLHYEGSRDRELRLCVSLGSKHPYQLKHLTTTPLWFFSQGLTM